MCGIAGIIQSNPNIYQQDQLQKMTDALAHRGPDGEGHWCNPGNHIRLGHRRLSIIDLSESGKQPMHFLDRYSIIHNGEIYNHIELREGLQKKGYHFHTRTDTEVIAAAWDLWREDCLKEFDGMFAFAIWDEQQQELFAATDRMGEKPFYFHPGNGSFLFGSEMKALWAAGVMKRPNLKMLFNFLTIGYTDNPEKPGETFYEEIFRLPPATYLKFSLRYFTYTMQSYWSVPDNQKTITITDQEATEKFNELFEASIERRLRSDVPVGSSVSGGLDSSTVVAIMNSSKRAGSSFAAFTASFPGFEKDELRHARTLAKTYQLDHQVVNISAGELLDDWQQLCYHQEEPFGSASAYAQFRVYRLAKETGIKVLLDGQGADEILAGYHKYYKWYWQELFRRNRLRRSGEIPGARELGIREPFTWKNRIAAWFPSFASIVMERQYLARALAHPDLTRDFIRTHSHDAYYTPPDHFSLNGVLHFNSFVHGLPELLRLADRNAMAHGRETRFPFLSHELVEFLFSLPPHYKIRKGWTKWLLRESMKEKLPDGIVWRKDKVGFEPPQKIWMEDPGIQDAIRTARARLVKENILKPEVLNRVIVPAAAHETGNDDWRYFSASLLFEI